MAARRQDAWEAQLKEKAFLGATIKPIVDETVNYNPPIPYALRRVKRSMDRGIHFRNNTHGLAGIAGDPHAAAIHEYGDWAQWAQIPAGNVAERNEGLRNYAKSITGNAYISEFGAPDERNDGRAQETAALSFIHMENFVEMDELRQEIMMTATASFTALKQQGGRGGGGGAAMRAEKPEKMVAEMQTLELIDELQTRKNGDDMSWDGFKHILGSYSGIKTKFNNYLNKHETDVVWRAQSQAGQVRDFITSVLDGFDGPGVRAKEAVVERALRFRQKSHMTTSNYLELKEPRFDEALCEGNTAGHVDTRICDEPERCRNAVEHLLAAIEMAVRDHLTDVSLAGHVIVGYSMDHFTEWTVVAKQVRRLAIPSASTRSPHPL